jgi:hypothetical protein
MVYWIELQNKQKSPTRVIFNIMIEQMTKTNHKENIGDTQLLKLITPQVIGTIWLLQNQRTKFSAAFNMINYLSNGQIINLHNQYRSQEDKAPQKGLFISDSFGERFFIAQLSQKEREKRRKELAEMLSVIKSSISEERNKVLIIDLGSKGWIEQLENDFPQISFEYLKYS